MQKTLKCISPTATLTSRKEYKGTLLKINPNYSWIWGNSLYKECSLNPATHFQCKDDKGITRIYKLDRFKSYG